MRSRRDAGCSTRKAPTWLRSGGWAISAASACSSSAAATADSRVGIARDAAHVLAFDPDADAVERARRSLPRELAERVTYRVASGKEIEIEPHSFDLVVFSWSL